MIPIERATRDGHKLKPEMRAHLQAKAKELGLPTTTSRANTADRASAWSPR
jgi:hypothetical protein